MFKRILVPVDPARPFGAANDYACLLATRYGSTIIANYIVDETLVTGAGEAVAALDSALEYVGREAVDDFARNHPEIQVEKRMSYGPTATVIFQTVLSTGADLVVLGGYTLRAGLHPWGSRVVDIVSHAERSTIVVRGPARLPTSDDRIMVPYDGSTIANEALLQICVVAKELGCLVDLVHVARPKHMAAGLHLLERGRIIAEGEGARVETHGLARPRLQSKGRVLLEHALRSDVRLVAMSRLGQSSMSTGQSRTLTWLLTHSDVPIWVVRR
jgi:nucleotide-binding universal stress UspA family protein